MLVERLRSEADPNEAIEQLGCEQTDLAPTFTAIGALLRATSASTVVPHPPESRDADTVEFKTGPQSLGSISIEDLHVRANSNRYDVQE